MNFLIEKKQKTHENGIRNFQMGRDLWDHVDSVMKSLASGWITVIILAGFLEFNNFTILEYKLWGIVYMECFISNTCL